MQGRHKFLQKSSQNPLYLTNPTLVLSGLVVTGKKAEQIPQKRQVSSLVISTDSVPASEPGG